MYTNTACNINAIKIFSEENLIQKKINLIVN